MNALGATLDMKHQWCCADQKPYTPKVSCRSETRWFHVGQETF